MQSPERRPRLRRTIRNGTTLGVVGLVAAVVLPSCASGLFFRPTEVAYCTPATAGATVEDVWFRSADGTRLHGWWLAADGEPRGAVVFCHGNNRNLTHHVRYARWMCEHGFAVLLFDYRGYGQSEGSPSRSGCIDDTCAAIDLALEDAPGL